MPRRGHRTIPLRFHLAVPAAGSGPGVLVLHAWWGLNDFFKGLCERLADAGFVALAPDLYDGSLASTVEEAKALRARTTTSRPEPVYKTLIRAIGELSRHEAVSSPELGIVGFSMGGHWALWLAQRPDLPVAATVAFYAARNGDYASSHSQFLFHLAEKDPWVSAASVAALRKSLAAAGREAQFHVYPHATHWFFEADRPDAYNPVAADLSWDRTIAFLRGKLQGDPSGGSSEFEKSRQPGR